MSAIEYRITIEPEDTEPNFENADGTPDKVLIAEIYRRLESDLWAWCYVIVTASIDGCPLTGRSALGGCSYFGGEVEFTRPGGYYEDLCAEAKADLLSKIDAVKALVIES